MRPDGPWWIWVTRDGHLLVTEANAPPPDRTAWPVGASDTLRDAHACCFVVGVATPGGGRRVEEFAGTIGAALRLQEQLVEWCKRKRQHGPSPSPAPAYSAPAA